MGPWDGVIKDGGATVDHTDESDKQWLYLIPELTTVGAVEMEVQILPEFQEQGFGRHEAVFIALRNTGSLVSGYGFYLHLWSFQVAEIELVRYNAGISSTYTIPWPGPGIVKLRFEDDGEVIKTYVNGVQFFQITDPSPVPDGHPGMGFTTNIFPTPASDIRITSYTVFPRQPKLLVDCLPATVVRGQDVTCTARLNTGEDWAYLLALTTELGADPDDPGAQAEPDMSPTPDGKGQFTTGKAVFSSTVTVTGQVGGSPGPLVSGSGSFKVKNRPDFPAPVLPAPKQAPEYTLVSPNFPPTALGGYVGPTIDFTPKTGPALPYQPVDAGPNRGYSYLTAPPAFKKPIILLHFSMIGQGDWFLEQNGVDHGEHTAANGLPYCNYEDITDRLDSEVKRHEAGPVKSHHTIWRQIFQQQRTINFFDRYYFRTELGEKQGRNKLENKWSKFKTRPDVQAAHELWDNEDNGANYEHVQEHIQCAFDNTQGD